MKNSQHGARIASEYIYTILFAIIFLLVFMIHPSYSSGKINVKKDAKPFDSNKDPIWVTQLTDIHVSDVMPENEEKLQKWCTHFKNYIKPVYAIFSGDLADNYGTSEPPTYSHPTEEHWKRYRKAIDNSGFDTKNLFEVFGNHDIWGINEWNEGEEFAAIYTTTPRDNFIAYSATAKKGLRVIGFVPQEFPTGHGGQAFLPALNSKMLDRLEEVLESTESDDIQETIVVTHYTHELIFPRTAKSKKGNSLYDILEKHDAHVFMNGHTHPAEPEHVHQRTFLELTGTALKRTDGFHFLTFDNGRLNYRLVSENKADQCTVTNPAPQELARYNFPDTDFPIRLISFSPSQTKNFKVTGDFEGTMTFKRYIDDEDSVALYELDAHFDSGIHTIHIGGDWEEDVTFAVNCESGPFKETHKCDVPAATGPVGVALYLFLLVVLNLFMWLPFEIDIIEKQAQFILGKSDEGQNWWLLPFAGPVCFGRVLYHLKLWFKIFFSVISFWPICLPIMIYKTENAHSMLWMWGYVSNSTYRFDVLSMIIGGIYLLGICMGVINFSGPYTLMKKHGWSYFFIIDFVIILIFLIVDLYFMWIYVADIGWKSYWGGSFTFIIFPCLAIILYLVDFFFLSKLKTENEESSSDLKP